MRGGVMNESSNAEIIPCKSARVMQTDAINAKVVQVVAIHVGCT